MVKIKVTLNSGEVVEADCDTVNDAMWFTKELIAGLVVFEQTNQTLAESATATA